jgi:hypothetical protein
MFYEWSHEIPAKVKDWDGNQIDSIPIIHDPIDNQSIQHMRWSNDTGFITVMEASREPKSAWIVRMSDKKWIYLGDEPYHPDLWISPVSGVLNKKEGLSAHPLKVTSSQGGIQIRFSGRGLHEVTLYNPRGVTLFKSSWLSGASCMVPVTGFYRGVYVVLVKDLKRTVVQKVLVR